MTQLEVYECKHCAGAVKPGAERCAYCGYWFVDPPKDIRRNIPKIDVEIWNKSEIIKSKIYIEYKGHLVEINGNVDYAVSSPMTYIHGISGSFLGIHEGPPDATARLSTMITSESVQVLRMLYNSHEYFNVMSTGKEDGVPSVVFEMCKIETMLTRHDDRDGIQRVLVDLLLRPLKIKDDMAWVY